jgi:uncharacterized coiled-coil protein SlyX
MKADKDRITDLEISLTHIQRMYEQLNEVVTSQSLANQRLEQQISQLKEQIKQLKEKPQPAIDPMQEKPPHY